MITLSKVVYDLFLAIYYSVAWLLSHFRLKEKQWIAGRKETFSILQSSNKKSPSKRVWFHCSSLGEFEQARPLIETIKSKTPYSLIYLSFFSPSGYVIRKNYPLADYVFYLPFDSQKNASKLLDIISPELVFWTKYDFWYYTLSELKKRKVNTVLFSANFRVKQIFFNQYGMFFRLMLQSFSKIFVQNDVSKILLNSIGISAEIAGDTRFDRVYQIAQNASGIDEIAGFITGKKVIVAGSTWPEDEDLISKSVEALANNNFKIIIAPHNIDKASLHLTKKRFEGNYEIFSALPQKTEKPVLIIDNIGLLSSIYQYADITYIGGGFGKSVHNVLEAAAFGKPLLYGPNHKKSLEAIDLIACGAAKEVNSKDDIGKIILQLYHNNVSNHIGLIAAEYVKKNIGATDKILSSQGY